MADQGDHVTCEICGLPHRLGVALCEDCGHVIGRTPDWPALRSKRSSYARQFGVALAAIVGMFALNVVLFGGAGYIFLSAPVVWLVMSGYQYRLITKFLDRTTEPVDTRW